MSNTTSGIPLGAAAGWSLARRSAYLLCGLVLMGLSIAAMKQAEVGLSPWDVLHDGIARHTGTDLGIVGLVLGIPILLLWPPLRLRPGPGTLANVAVVGWVIHVALGHSGPVHGLGTRWAVFGAGMAGLAVGQGAYLAAGLGAGPRDGLMTGLHHRFGISIRLARTGLELVALGAGALLGGSVGAGTLVFAVGIGPMVQVALRAFGYPVRVDTFALSGE